MLKPDRQLCASNKSEFLLYNKLGESPISVMISDKEVYALRQDSPMYVYVSPKHFATTINHKLPTASGWVFPK